LTDVVLDTTSIGLLVTAVDKNHNITDFTLPDNASDDHNDEIDLILDRNTDDSKFDINKLASQDLDYIIKKLGTNHHKLAKLILSKPVNTHVEKFFNTIAKNYVLNALELTSSGLTDDHVDHVGKFLEKNSSIDS
jgi:hypothetical protein